MAKSTKRKPSFDASDDAGASSGASSEASWVYRSDEATAEKPKKKRARASAKKTSGRRTAGSSPNSSSTTADRAASESPSTDPKTTAVPDRRAAALRIVERHAKYSAAAGLVPIPLIDVAAIAGVQVAMLDALATHYGLRFSRERGKVIVAALLGSLMPSLAGSHVLKIVGPLAGMISVSGFALAATHAVGRVFITHFEAGGTLLDVDLDQARQQVSEELSRS